jgi:hypothetical protein
MNITISFTSEGTAHCLWTEALPLHELSQLQVTSRTSMTLHSASCATSEGVRSIRSTESRP